MCSPSQPAAPDYKAAADAMRTNQVTPFGSSTWSNTPSSGYGPPQGGTSQYSGGPSGISGTGTPHGPFGLTGGSTLSGGGLMGMGAPNVAPTSSAPASNGGNWGVTPNVGGTTGGARYGPNGQVTDMVNGGTSQNPGAGPQTPAGTPTNTTTLSPDIQKALTGITGQAASNFSKPPDFSSVGDVANKAYGAFTSRLDPQWAQQQQQQESALRNQGLVPGGEAYDNAMRTFNNAKTDAYQQANLGAIQTMPQTYQLATAQRDQPLNEINAIRTGTQIGGPQFEGSPNYLGAAQQQGQFSQGLYNAQVGQQNAMTSGLFGLGAAGLLAFA